MKIKFNETDKKLLVLFYTIAIPISLYGDFEKYALELILDTMIYVVFSLTSLWIIVFWFFPKYLPKGQFFKLIIFTTLFLIAWGQIEINLYRVVTYLSEGKFNDWSKFSIIEILLYGLESALENTGILLGMFLGKKFYDAQLDIQKREKEKQANELRILKSQIDPHFLFNNLNTVDSLIDNNPTIAKEYVNKLSQLYRYLITTKDDEIVHLKDELSFAENYSYLLKKRFGDAYLFNIEIPVDKEDCLIPPGALQTVLENVIKHNQGSSEKPVLTTVKFDDTSVSISNNIQLKNRGIETTGTGLKNLIARYGLLTDLSVVIEESDEFKIVLPLIKNID